MYVDKSGCNDESMYIDKSGCNDENMYIDKSNKSKQNCCIFCMKSQSKLARHLERMHRNEPEVKKFAILPKRNLERKKIIEIIRKNGNFKYNTNAAVINKGQLIVCRRPNEKLNKTATDFVACMKCKGFFAKNSICHHARECFKQNFRTFKRIMIMGRKIICRIHKLANDIKKHSFPCIMRRPSNTSNKI